MLRLVGLKNKLLVAVKEWQASDPPSLYTDAHKQILKNSEEVSLH